MSGHRVKRTVHQRIYALVTVDRIPAVAGNLRRAAADDAELVGRWFAEFLSEALNDENADRARAHARQRIRQGEVYLLEDAQPRAMAARSRLTRNTITVNAVYTPPAWRRRGFATAAVAALSRELLGEGFSMCVLYTDLANPTSNSIYQRIGNRPVSDPEHIVFT